MLQKAMNCGWSCFNFAIGSWFSIMDDGYMSEIIPLWCHMYNHSVKAHKEEATLGPLMLGLIQ